MDGQNGKAEWADCSADTDQGQVNGRRRGLLTARTAHARRLNNVAPYPPLGPGQKGPRIGTRMQAKSDRGGKGGRRTRRSMRAREGKERLEGFASGAIQVQG